MLFPNRFGEVDFGFPLPNKCFPSVTVFKANQDLLECSVIKLAKIKLPRKRTVRPAEMFFFVD